MLGPVFSLAGDSYPLLPHIEEALRARLAPSFESWADQQAILDRMGEPGFDRKILRRVELLDRLMPVGEESRRAFLIGRSSGARVATLYAWRRPVAGVVCLGYPFRDPNTVLEPARFAHLAEIAVPTLIIQGRNDRFGSEEITEHYPFSASVTIRFVDGNHEHHLAPDAWDEIARTILAFCDRAERGLPPERMPFDEAFYLRAHPDVAAAVAAGKIESGEQHYLKHGRRERRRFRLISRGA
jgi:alpha-beta hydrolase superfamily lysophospholipase